MKHNIKVLITSLVFASSLLLPAKLFSQAGSLDLSFGTGGRVLTDFNISNEYGRSVAIQDDGKIVVAGNHYDGSYNGFGVVRYNTNGSLDTTFNLTGKVITSIGSFTDNCNSLEIQSDGKIVVAGESHNGVDYDFAVARYNTDGSLDSTFNSDGIAITDIESRDDRYASVKIQNDGKIVVAGTSGDSVGENFAVVRYNINGDLDSTFGGDGKVITSFGIFSDIARAVSIQTDGKIVVAGDSFNGTDRDFAVVRYRSDGSLDISFDTDGIVTTPISVYNGSIGSGGDYGTSVAIQSDGKIIVSGHIPSNYFALVRYNTDGSVDNTFDSDGIVTSSVGGYSNDGTSVAIQSDGKILVAGDDFNGSVDDMALVRYNSNGSLDSTFDADGIVTTAFDPGWEIAYSVVLQNDAKIVMAGYAVGAVNGADFCVYRFNNDFGAGISTFAEQKIELTIYPNPSSGLFTILLPSDNAEITVTNIAGQQITKTETAQRTTNLQLDNDGVYFVYVKSKQGTTTRKLIVNR